MLCVIIKGVGQSYGNKTKRKSDYMTYSPSPWSYTYVQEKGIYEVTGRYNEWIANVRVIKANADLIVAAPELLESLESLLEVIQGPLCDMVQIINRAQDIIKKAKG